MSKRSVVKPETDFKAVRGTNSTSEKKQGTPAPTPTSSGDPLLDEALKQMLKIPVKK